MRVTSYQDWEFDDYDEYYHHSGYKSVNIDKAVSPLIEKLASYDTARLELQAQGGTLEDLQRIVGLFQQEMKLNTAYGTKYCCIAEKSPLKHALLDVSTDLALDTRKLTTQLPVFYLHRRRSDTWSGYPVVVQSLYQSPDYPDDQEQFVKVMRNGKEIYAISLAQFRGGVEQMLNNTDRKQIDKFMSRLAKLVFQSAWHDDQRFSYRLAAQESLQLKSFQKTVEMLYLILSADLCDVRNGADASVLRFFDEVYPQAPIRRLLEHVIDMDGAALAVLPNWTKPLYLKLGRAFTRYLTTTIPRGVSNRPMPIWKLLYANFGRLDLIAEEICESSDVKQRQQELFGISDDIVNVLCATG